MRIAVLGGAGAMGREIVRELLANEGNEVFALDRTVSFFDHQGSDWMGNAGARLQWAPADLVDDSAGMVRLLRDAAVLINATTHHLNLPAMRVALEANCHYLDLGGL
ncbi:MAG: saccharopine dehydrogenase NADP-binding domain-containing protein, partial [Verrucomicrobiae bacterium]|nr:saccharopine dehydrogenase NADP-binding domain-containing protein [Verrucomicrobiae bacterium]